MIGTLKEPSKIDGAPFRNYSVIVAGRSASCLNDLIVAARIGGWSPRGKELFSERGSCTYAQLIHGRKVNLKFDHRRLGTCYW